MSSVGGHVRTHKCPFFITSFTYSNLSVSVKKTNEEHKFAATQIHHTIMGREEYLLREVSLKEYKNKEYIIYISYYAIRFRGNLMKKGERGALKPPPYISTELLHPVPDPKSGKGLNSCSERHKRLENS